MRRLLPAIGLRLVLCLGVCTSAHASQTIPGRVFLVKDRHAGATVSRRQILVVGESVAGNGQTIIGDPTVGGAAVQVVATGGALVTQSDTYPMPAAGWSRLRGAARVGYQYVDRRRRYGPVRSARIEVAAGRLLLKVHVVDGHGRGRLPSIRLVPPGPGTGGGAVFTIRDGESYCVTFGGPAGGKVTNRPPKQPGDELFAVRSTASHPTVAAGCMAAKPNIVLILTDDQRWDTVDATHSVTGTTPVMPIVTDELVAHGVTFKNAFLPTPLCTPSRTSILTGRYAHHTGAEGNVAVPPSVFGSTIATDLHGSGYRTGFYGKFPQIVADPPGWDDWQAFRVTASFDYVLANNGDPVRYGTEASDYATDVLAQKVVDFIDVRSAQPFFAFLATYAPHSEGAAFAQPAPPDVASFRSVPPWRPPGYDEADVGDKPSWVQSLPRAFDLLCPSCFATWGAWIDGFRESQLEALQAVDRAVGRIVAELRRTGLAGNTVIVLLSDNGMTWGEHRIWESKNVPYEEAIRTPLVVRDPRSTDGPRDATALVASIDLAPTIAELAGTVSSRPMDGRSVVPLLENRPAAWRTDLLIEAWATARNPSFAGVRTDRWKYVAYSTGETELYDLLNDPDELRNAAADPGNQAFETVLSARLAELLQ